jgi:hypothetical protein
MQNYLIFHLQNLLSFQKAKHMIRYVPLFFFLLNVFNLRHFNVDA